MCGEPDQVRVGPPKAPCPKYHHLLPHDSALLRSNLFPTLFYHLSLPAFTFFSIKMTRFFTPLLFLLAASTLNAQQFIDASAQLPNNGASQQSMDIRAADLDNDGDLDIVLANEGQPNTLLFNDGNGNFTTAPAGLLPPRNQDSEDVAIADFNGDGWLDLVFCSEDDIVLGEQDVHEYYLGSAEGQFIAVSGALLDSEANAVITADINNDGWPDLLFGNDGPTTLLLNDQTGSFIVDQERVPAVNRTTQDLLLVDLTGDGHPDLIEGNENGNRYFINDGSGFFTDETVDRLPSLIGLETRKLVAGDIDGDDDLDLFLCNVAFLPGRNPQNRLWINDGEGSFSDATATQLPVDQDHSLDALLIDMDGDQDLDIFVANIAGAPQKVYRNDGTGNFTIATTEILGENYIREGLGLFAADFNGDDLTDIYLCDRKIPSTSFKDLLLLRTSVNAANTIENPASWTIHPNPVHDSIFVRGTILEKPLVMIMDTQGKAVGELNLNQVNMHEYSARWPAHLPQGTYFITINGQSRKVIKV